MTEFIIGLFVGAFFGILAIALLSANKEQYNVPLCKIGDTAYFLLEDDIPEHKWFLSEEKITEVGTKGFFVSEYRPPEDDLSNYTLWDEVGKTVFFARTEAERALAERRDK